jgi:transmembrane sensor
MKKETGEFDKWMQKTDSLELKSKMEADWEIIQSRINLKTNLHSITAGKKASWRWLSSAAAIVILLVSTSLILLNAREFKTIKTSSTELQVFTLADGSSVQFSKGSKILVPREFSMENREITLKGEAYFDIVSNPKSPFTVHTGETKIRVTGTAFKVSAFRSSREVSVRVDSGKVLFYNSEDLKPNAFKVGLGAGDIGIYLPKLHQLNKKQYIATP